MGSYYIRKILFEFTGYVWMIFFYGLYPDRSVLRIHLVELNPDATTLKLVSLHWKMSELNNLIVKIITEEAMGIPVAVTHASSKDEMLDGISKGTNHAFLELWGMNTYKKSNNTVLDNIVSYGPLGSVGNIGWFVPSYVTEADHAAGYALSLINSTTLLFFQEHADSVTKLLENNGSTENSPGIYHGTKDFPNHDSDIIENLNLNLRIVTTVAINDTFSEEDALMYDARVAYSKKLGHLFYFWRPHGLFHLASGLKFQRVSIPNRQCDTAQSNFACDYPLESLTKIGAPNLINLNGGTCHEFIKNFRISTTDQEHILAAVYFYGMSDYDAACQWVRMNEGKWRMWIPLRASNNKVTILTSVLLPIIIVLITLNLLLLRMYRHRSSTCHPKFYENSFQGTHNRSVIISHDELDMRYIIGIGGHGVVNLAIWRGTTVAVKRMFQTDNCLDVHSDGTLRKATEPSENDSLLKQLHHEIVLLTTFRHPNIVLCLGSVVDPLSIVMEYMDRGSLDNIVFSDKPFPWPLRIKLMHDAAMGMLFLHNSGIIHKDFKTGNVLVHEMWVAKVCDFGLSMLELGQNQNDHGYGTALYQDPLCNGDFSLLTRESDVYSFGISCACVSSRNVPYYEQLNTGLPVDAILYQSASGLRPSIQDPRGHIEPCPTSLEELIVRCWMKESACRPTFQDIVDVLHELKVANNFGI